MSIVSYVRKFWRKRRERAKRPEVVSFVEAHFVERFERFAFEILVSAHLRAAARGAGKTLAGLSVHDVESFIDADRAALQRDAEAMREAFRAARNEGASAMRATYLAAEGIDQEMADQAIAAVLVRQARSGDDVR